MKCLLMILLTVVSINSYSKSEARGHEGGNGGDPIRLEFIKIGKELLTEYKVAITSRFGKDKLQRLEESLSIKHISLSDKVLYDNGASLVSALGDTNGIVLYIGNEQPDLTWNNLLSNKTTARKIIFHEMLRFAGINDDDYIYTNELIKLSGKVNLNQIIELPETIQPLTISDLVSKGLRYDFAPQSLCGDAEGFQLSLTTDIECSQGNNTCSVKNIWTNSELFEFQLSSSAKNNRFISSAILNKTRGVLSCDYKREIKNDCASDTQEIASSLSCNLLLSDKLKYDGTVHLQQHRQQQRQQRQQQQQQQQRNRLN